jgi:long-chain acyl-CoA synthetase
MENRRPPEPVILKPEPKPLQQVFATLPQNLRHQFNQTAGQTALCQKKAGIWHKYTWRESFDTVKMLTLGLLSLGMTFKDSVCLCGETAPEAFWAQLAAQSAGGTFVSIPVEAAPADIVFICNAARPKFAFVSGWQQAEKFLTVKAQIPSVQKIIYWDAKRLAGNPDPLLLRFSALLEMGAEFEKTNSTLFKQNVDRGYGEDRALIAYTLTSKGTPTGTVMTHNALTGVGRALLHRWEIQPGDNVLCGMGDFADLYFAVLPHLIAGAALNFPETTLTFANDRKELAPDFAYFTDVDKNKLAEQIASDRASASGLKSFFYQTFWKSAAQKPGFAGKLLLARPLLAKFGLNKVNFAGIDGADLQKDDYDLIQTAGILLRLAFTLKEAGVISAQGPDQTDDSNVGRPLAGTEVRITNDGELLVRGVGLFSGYINDQPGTDKVLINGWLHTGLKAALNEKGELSLLSSPSPRKQGR